MTNMRVESYYAGEFLIQRLRASGVMKRVLHDGGDIILFRNCMTDGRSACS
ncbi:MAG: hypothetical protein HND48_18490 [Chloroflexi bacterium]|nr:hypothetical protein [Chloroflexota bacterium]